METTMKEDPGYSPRIPPSMAILGTRIPTGTAFILAILLFLLPFAEVRCNGKVLANNTGLGIAIGSEWKEQVTKNIFGDSFENDARDTREYNPRRDPNAFAIAALALGIIGFVIAISKYNRWPNLNFYTGLLAAASLIGMLVHLRSKARSDASLKSSDLHVDVGIQITVNGTVWFYLSVILFIVAAIFSLWQAKPKTS